MTPEDLEIIKTKQYRVEGACGREWVVPLQAVMNDYIHFLETNDNITRKEAIRRTDINDITSWFHEQFNWSDVEKYGKMVKEASQKTIEDALNIYRGNSFENVIEEINVEKESLLKKRKLRKIANKHSDNTELESSKNKRSPKM